MGPSWRLIWAAAVISAAVEAMARVAHVCAVRQADVAPFDILVAELIAATGVALVAARRRWILLFPIKLREPTFSVTSSSVAAAIFAHVTVVPGFDTLSSKAHPESNQCR